MSERERAARVLQAARRVAEESVAAEEMEAAAPDADVESRLRRFRIAARQFLVVATACAEAGFSSESHRLRALVSELQSASDEVQKASVRRRYQRELERLARVARGGTASA